MVVIIKEYFKKVHEILEKLENTQLNSIQKASKIISESLIKGGVLHLFGTGHSHMIAEEPFYRAGGLAAVNTILEPSLLGKNTKSGLLERLEGYGKIIVDTARFSENDVLIVISVSGRNAVPIEVAMEAKNLGIPVIAITSMDYSREIKSRHSSGKHLCDVADIVIDNCVPVGDAVLKIKGSPQKVSAVSTILGAAIINAIIGQVTKYMVTEDIKPPVFLSGNIDGADKYNAQLIEKYKDRINFF